MTESIPTGIPASSPRTTEDKKAPDLPSHDVVALLKGGREALLHHDGQIYRLRITSNRKLILTK